MNAYCTFFFKLVQQDRVAFWPKVKQRRSIFFISSSSAFTLVYSQLLHLVWRHTKFNYKFGHKMEMEGDKGTEPSIASSPYIVVSVPSCKTYYNPREKSTQNWAMHKKGDPVATSNRLSACKDYKKGHSMECIAFRSQTITLASKRKRFLFQGTSRTTLSEFLFPAD